MPDFDTTGPSHAPAPPEPTTTAPAAAVPGRRAIPPAVASSPRRGVEIAPDLRDHAVPPALRAEVDTELRTLVAHVERNVEQFSLASTQPDREAALGQLDTRVDLALMNVPADLHAKLRAELIATLGDRHAAVARVLATADRTHGARAAQFFGVELAGGAVTTPVQRFATTTRGAVDVQAHAARGLTAPASALPHHDAIQKAFGHHDVGGVRAHVGGVAADAAAAIGASAYATGDEIAFASDPDLRLAAHEAAHVVQQRGGVQVAGGVGSAGDAYEQHADQVAELVVRGENAEALLDQLAHRGSTGGRAIQRHAPERPDPDPGAVTPQFVTAFNREFAAQLHVLGHPIAATSAQTDPHAASGAALTAAELAALFTANQQGALLRFCTDHLIPDHLFDGDEPVLLDAQQRIVLSTHILSVGRYRAGAIDQRVHARMCGHWAELVIAYAGAAEAGPGVEQDTDHAGRFELTVVDDSAGTPVSGEDHHTTGGVTTRATGHDAAAAFEQAGLPFERYGLDGTSEVHPGDWIYIFNNNGAGGGNHSLIFSRWAGPPATVRHGGVDVRYRPAFAASQRDPDFGGSEELIYLGDHFMPFNGSQITPLTLINHISPSARPVHDSEDVSAMLGTGDVARQNEVFAQARCAGACDWTALAGLVRERNTPLIASLGSRLTSVQRAALTETNLHPHGATPIAIVAELVRLNERLRSLVHQSELLTDGTYPVRTDRGGHEHPSPYAQAETRSATHVAERDRAEEALSTSRAQRDEVRARHGDLPAIAEVDAAVASVEQLEHDAAFARGQRRQQAMQNQLAAARRQLAQIRRADPEHAALYTAESAYLDAVEAVEQARAQVELHDYHLAATGISRDPFQGTTGAIPVTGLVANLDPQPDWSALAIHAE